MRINFYVAIIVWLTEKVRRMRDKQATLKCWSHREGKDDRGERFVGILEIPPVVSTVMAVPTSVIADKKKRQI